MFAAELSHVHCAIYKVQMAINLFAIAFKFENIYSIKEVGKRLYQDPSLRAYKRHKQMFYLLGVKVSFEYCGGL